MPTSATLNLGATARQPRQARSRQRFAEVLRAAEELLRAGGLRQFSIPQIAERLDCSRNAIYKFFPTPYALLNELTQRKLQEHERVLETIAKDDPAPNWQAMVERIAAGAAEYYDANPVASLLILGGSATDDSSRLLELTVHHLGGHVRRMMAAYGHHLPEGQPDVATMTAEIGSAAFRLSYHVHQHITPAYQAEAARAMIAYLSLYAR